MHELVFFNREILSVNDASVVAAGSAGLYGKGIFTTIAIYERKTFLWRKHWFRLKSNAEKIGIDLSEFNEDSVVNAISETVSVNKTVNARARLTFFDETPGGTWSYAGKRKTSFLIMTGEKREIPANFRLTVSPFKINSTSPLANVKSCNYLEKIIALDEAKKRGFDEALQTNERGEIASACMANVFWTEKGKFFTPSLETGCLAGTTRELLLEKFNCIETSAPPEILQKADAIYLTSAGLGVVQIGEYGNRKYELKLDEITQSIPPI